MPAGKQDSDQEKLFSIELLTIQQVAEWAKTVVQTTQDFLRSNSPGWLGSW
jgi:hypothetical protein